MGENQQNRMTIKTRLATPLDGFFIEPTLTDESSEQLFGQHFEQVRLRAPNQH